MAFLFSGLSLTSSIISISLFFTHGKVEGFIALGLAVIFAIMIFVSAYLADVFHIKTDIPDPPKSNFFQGDNKK